MSETNDAAANKIDFGSLKEYAMEMHGMRILPGTSRAEVNNLLEREGENLATLHERVGKLLADKVKTVKTAELPAGTRLPEGAKEVLGHVFFPDPDPAFNVIDTIMIYEDEINNKPVYIAVNNRNVLVPRGKEMPVRRPFRLQLANCIEESWNPETKETTRRPRFPFTVIQYDVSGASAKT